MFRNTISALILFVFSTASFADDKGPAWWKVSDEDTTILITGTIHLTKPELNWLTEERKALVAGADALILEMSPEEQDPVKLQPLMMKYGMYPAGQSLKGTIGEELFGQLAAATGGRVPEMMLDRMRPWLAGVTVSVLNMMQAGYDPESGADKTYQKIAQAAGVPVEGLETAELQLSVLASMGGDDATASVELLLEELPKTAEIVDTMTEAWMARDMAGLESVITEGMKAYPDLAEALLYKRNRNWAEQVDALMERPGTFVIAVGAGHLIGEQSLLDLLEKAGENVSSF